MAINCQYRAVLFSGHLCHLCDQAKTIIYAALPAGMSVDIVIVSDDQSLMAEYGVRIPVFAFYDGATLLEEKNWPFTEGQVKRIVSARF